MRSVFFGIGLLFSLALLSPAAHATGNVLLPSPLPSDTSSLPNLGLGFSGASSSDTNAAAMLPQSSNSAPTPSIPVVKRTAPQLPTGQAAPIIVQQKDMSQEIARTGRNLPYRLALLIDKKSVFGSKDVQSITSKLGLKPAQISSSCILTLEGMMHSDQGGYFIVGGSQPPPIMIPYAGAIKDFMMSAAAICAADPAKLPRNGGLILTQINGLFDIMLQPVSCPPPRGQASSLTIAYDGSGKSQCVYN